MLKSTKDNAVFFSKIFKQEDIDSDWLSYKPTVKTTIPQINILPETTSTTLETDTQIYEGMGALLNDGTVLKEGTLVNVQTVASGDDTISGLSYYNKVGNLKSNVLVDSPLQHITSEFSTGGEYGINDIRFSADGKTIYLTNTTTIGVTNDVIESYSLGTPFNTATVIMASRKVLDLTQWTYGPHGLVIDNDGGGFYLFSGNDADGNRDRVLRFTMTGGDITTASYVGMSGDLKTLLGVTELTTYSMIADNLGRLYVIDIYKDAIFRFSETVAGDVTTLVYDGINLMFNSVAGISTPITFPTDVRFSTTGHRLFVSTTGSLYQFNLSSNYDISTATKGGEITTKNTFGIGYTLWAFHISPDGRKFYFANSTSSTYNRHTVHEYSIIDAWNINTSNISVPANEFKSLRIY